MFKTLAGGALAVLVAVSAQAAPLEDTCRLAEIMGGNEDDEVEAFLTDVADLWSDDLRASATRQLETLAGGNAFAGGSVWHIADFGDDLQEYLIILRLQAGEVSFARVRYEWSRSGLALTSLEIKRSYAEAMAVPFAQSPVPTECPG